MFCSSDFLFPEGFQHKEDVKSLDLTVVRLCVQVVLLGENGNTRIGISPIVSDPVYNKRLFFYPYIHKLSHCSSYVDGKNHNSEQIILLGCKVSIRVGVLPLNVSSRWYTVI